MDLAKGPRAEQYRPVLAAAAQMHADLAEQGPVMGVYVLLRVFGGHRREGDLQYWVEGLCLARVWVPVVLSFGL